MNRHQLREHAMILLYESLLRSLPIAIIISLHRDGFDDFIPALDLDEYFDALLDVIDHHKSIYIQNIEHTLIDWQYHRLGYIEQAILLLAYGELMVGEVDRPIVIDEAIELAKAYGDDVSYRLINGTLDTL